jgi:hypothetical protein
MDVVVSSMISGTAIKPSDVLVVYNFTGYDGSLEKCCFAKNLKDEPNTPRVATLTITSRADEYACCKTQVQNSLMEACGMGHVVVLLVVLVVALGCSSVRRRAAWQ